VNEIFSAPIWRYIVHFGKWPPLANIAPRTSHPQSHEFDALTFILAAFIMQSDALVGFQ
jgi:hypothetical protein